MYCFFLALSFLYGARRDCLFNGILLLTKHNGIHTALDATNSRRAFMGTSSAFVASTSLTLPVFAEEGSVDDLAMPTEGDKKDEVSFLLSL